MTKFNWLEIAPYGAGSPPALVLALNLYKSILTATSPDMWALAAFTALLGIVFTIAIEAGTYKALALAFASREWKAAGVAALGSVTMTALIVYGVYSGGNTRALITSSVAMVCGYVLIMVLTYMSKRETVAAEGLREMAMQVEIKRAEMETARANARAAKANAQSAQVPAQSAHSPRTRCEVPGCTMDYATVGGKGGHYKKHHPGGIAQEPKP